MVLETGRTWAEISREALVHNLRLAQHRTNRKVMCVIKGDAHGHGAVLCGNLLQEHGADAFAVACFSEAKELRQGGITKPVLILGYTDPSLADSLGALELTQSVFSWEYAHALSEAARGPIQVHVKLDTGMSRTGLPVGDDPEMAAREVLRIAKLPNLELTGLFTHCAAADMPEKDDFTALQLRRFEKTVAALRTLGFDKDLTCHAGNSAVILNHPAGYFDMVRMGVMMYGFYPDGICREDGPLEPVLSLKTRVVQVKEIPGGTAVSYGCTFTAERTMQIAVVAAGYADAYPRALSNKGAYAVIGGKKCPQIGRICMDMCMFDVTGLDVKMGDEVILYGRGGMPLDQVAALTGSINCEATSLLTARIPKICV